MVTNNDFDTSYAKTVSQINPTTMSTFVPDPESVVRVFAKEQITYGKVHVTRGISVVDAKVLISRAFNPERQKNANKQVQDVDIPCLSDRLVVPRIDYAGDVQNVSNHVNGIGTAVVQGLDALLCIGSTNPVCYGITDYPNATAGTLNRPEQCAPVTTSGDWNTTANIRTDVINAILTLVGKNFKGRKVAIAPEIVKPMLTDLIANTAVPIAQWFSGTIGIPIVFSNYIDADATKDAFDVYVVDVDTIKLGATDFMMASFYDDMSHGYIWDWEVYAAPYFNPLWDGTEWLKGVCCISQCDWSD